MTPFVSIIMPVRNEGPFIQESLGAALAQDYPHDHLEILIADGMSTDDTRAMITELSAQQDISVSIVDNPKQIVSTGFNRAMQQARGEIIVRVDGHCKIAPDYVRQCVEHLQDDAIHGVGGPIETIGTNVTSQSIALAMSSKFGVGGTAFRTIQDRSMRVDTIPFPAYKRWVMDACGPLDEDLVRNQDDEYNYRLRKSGYNLLLTPRVRSTYHSRGSLRKLASQYFQYGYWKVRVLQKHPRQMSPRQFVPPAFVAGLVICGVLALFTTVGRALLSLVLVAYVATNLSASVLLARRYGWHHFLRLPLIFAVLHLSYGCGFWRGVIAFAGRPQVTRLSHHARSEE